MEDPGQPFAWLYRSTDVIAGLAVLVAVRTVLDVVAGHRWSRWGAGLLGLTGVASVVDGLTSMRCDPGTDLACARGEQSVHGLLGQLSAVHTDSGLLGFAAGAAGAILLGATMTDRWPFWGRVQIGIGVGIAFCGVADVALLLAGQDIGTAERSRVLLTSLWFLLIGGFLFTRRRIPAAVGVRPGMAR